MPPTSTPPRHRRPASRAAALTLYAHPFELATAVLLGTSALSTATHLEDVLDILNAVTVYTWAAATIVGIAGIVVGLFGSADLTGDKPGRRAAYRATEKAGLYLLASATAVVAILVEAALPFSESWVSDVQLGAITLACLLRAGAVRKAERITYDVLRSATKSADVAEIVADVLHHQQEEEDDDG